MEMPPSTRKDVPVTKLAASEARFSTHRAVSSGIAIRFSAGGYFFFVTGFAPAFVVLGAVLALAGGAALVLELPAAVAFAATFVTSAFTPPAFSPANR